MISIVIAILLLVASVLRFRVYVMMLPIIPFFFSKGFLFLDIPSQPVVSFYKVYCVCLIISFVLLQIVNRRSYIKKRKVGVSTSLLLLISVNTIILALNFEVFKQSVNVYISFIIEVIAPVFIFSYVASELSKDKFNNYILMYAIIILIISFYAIIAYLLKFNPYIDFIETTIKTERVLVHTYEDTLRGLRAQGTVSHPITFGVYSALSFPIIFLLKKYKIANIGFISFMSITIFIAVMLTNSRTPLLLLLLIIILSALSFKLKTQVKAIAFILVLFLLALNFSDVFYEKVISIINIFNPNVGADMHGSTLDMRFGQFAVALKYFLDSPFWGNGLAFTRIVVASGTEPDLYNTESILFELMMNYGLIGLIGYSLVFYKLFFNDLRMFSDKKLLINPLVVSYLITVVSTGWVDSFHVFLIFYCVYYCFIIKNSMEENKSNIIRI